MEGKIGVQTAARARAVATDVGPDRVLKSLNEALKNDTLWTLTDDKGRTVAVPADKVAYLYFTADSGRKVGFAK